MIDKLNNLNNDVNGLEKRMNILILLIIIIILYIIIIKNK